MQSNHTKSTILEQCAKLTQHLKRTARYTYIHTQGHRHWIRSDQDGQELVWIRLHNNYKLFSVRSIRQFFLLRFRSTLGKVHVLHLHHIN